MATTKQALTQAEIDSKKTRIVELEKQALNVFTETVLKARSIWNGERGKKFSPIFEEIRNIEKELEVEDPATKLQKEIDAATAKLAKLQAEKAAADGAPKEKVTEDAPI